MEQKKKMYSTTEAARLIGVKPYQLKYAIENESVDDVMETFAGRRIFTQEDIQRFKEYFHGKEKEGRNEI